MQFVEVNMQVRRQTRKRFLANEAEGFRARAPWVRQRVIRPPSEIAWVAVGSRLREFIRLPQSSHSDTSTAMRLEDNVADLLSLGRRAGALEFDASQHFTQHHAHFLRRECGTEAAADPAAE